MTQKTNQSKPAKKPASSLGKKSPTPKSKGKTLSAKVSGLARNQDIFNETLYAEPPRPRKVAVAIERFGHERIDDYFWLRDKENPETIQYLKDENRYAEKFLRPLKPLMGEVFKDLKGFYREVEESVPYTENGYVYLKKFGKGQQHPVWMRKAASGKSQKFQTILDVNKLAKGAKSFSMGSVKVCPKNETLAYSSDVAGAEEYAVHMIDLKTGKKLPHHIEKISGGIHWDSTGESIFYISLDKEHRGRWLRRYHLATKKIETIYELKTPVNFLDFHKTLSGRYLVALEVDRTSSEVHYLDLLDPNAKLKCFLKYRQDLMVDEFEHHGDYFLFRSNRDNIEYDFFRAPISSVDGIPGQKVGADWEVVRKSKAGETALTHIVLNHAHILLLKKNGSQKLHVRLAKDHSASEFGKEREVHFEEDYFDLHFSPDNVDTNATEVRVNYSSLVRPPVRYAIDLQTLEHRELKSSPRPKWFRPQDFVCEQLTAKSADGVKVPVTVLYHKKTPLNGTAPVVLDGYGSYGHDRTPGFRSSMACLAKRGFIAGVAHIRGGGDLGEHWHRSGKMQNKKNTFYDFIACAEVLVQKKYVDRKKVIIRGGSAGGMLMGASMNMIPGLFRLVVAHVPFVDVLNTMLDPTLPLTPPEYKEWGNPETSKEVYDYIRDYCPYTNVAKKPYPNVYVTAGLNDPRVTYWEPAKWVAKLREYKTNKNLIIFKTDMESGHAGASGRWDSLKELAEEIAIEIAATKEKSKAK